MSIDKIIEGLYIGPLEAAVESTYLDSLAISEILSIGCDVDVQNFRQLHSFPNILDNPEVLILDILPMTTAIISHCLEKGSSILVHCVYGQSRSAAVVVGYLMARKRLPLVEAISVLKSAHPCTSINPGFMSQLYCLSLQMHAEAEVKLALFSAKVTLGLKCLQSNGENITQPHNFDFVCINTKCRRVLASSHNLLTLAHCTDFLDEHVDSFWSGYKPIHMGAPKSLVKSLPLPSSHTVVGPIDWIREQVMSKAHSSNVSIIEKLPRPRTRTAELDTTSDNALAFADLHVAKKAKPAITAGGEAYTETGTKKDIKSRKVNKNSGFLAMQKSSKHLQSSSIVDTCRSISSLSGDQQLHCPGCGSECGYWRERGIVTCGGFIISHLFALDNNAIVKIRL